MPATLDDLMSMSQTQLDELYRAAQPGEIPDGDTSGTGIVLPGTWFERMIARFIRWFVWQGKVFDAKAGVLINKVSVTGVKAIRAKVYKGPSWLDGKECIVIDYSKTSFIAKKVRDEIREVSPGLYLGKVYWGKRRLIDFALVFRGQPRPVAWVNPVRAAVIAVLALLTYFALRFTSDSAVDYRDPAEHFKYGSTGGERTSGIPLAVWNALPVLFYDYLPTRVGEGDKYKAFGFLYETNADGSEKELPIGVSRRTVQGIDRVFFNCAICHAGSVREKAGGPRTIYAGMPSNTVDLQAYERFLFKCASDERFTPDRILAQISAQGGGGLDVLDDALLRYYGLYVMRERMQTLQHRFEFMEREPLCGPGRVDTFNPAKALLNFPMAKLPESEWVGLADFPSIWLQRAREGMQLHWDGNNTSLEERNRSAAFGTGAFPPTIDKESVKRIEDWARDVEPPKYPYAIRADLAARGAPLYAKYCAECHGKSGRDFTGEYVGKVVPLEKIGTDRARLDSYTRELCASQNTLYAGYPTRFSHFRKTDGYANSPLDGIWLRGPYLHNGSVPTVRDLLNESKERPTVFYRGNQVYDQVRLGFVTDAAEEDGTALFKYDTSLRGNGNRGHEGEGYGTRLPPEAKDAIVEYLKSF